MVLRYVAKFVTYMLVPGCVMFTLCRLYLTSLFFVAVLCTPVTFEPCASRGFTYTVFPNLFDQINMSRAEEAYMHVAKNVFNQVCQESALTYLCSLYFPKCDLETGNPEYPCLGLCEGTKQFTTKTLLNKTSI